MSAFGFSADAIVTARLSAGGGITVVERNLQRFYREALPAIGKVILQAARPHVREASRTLAKAIKVKSIDFEQHRIMLGFDPDYYWAVFVHDGTKGNHYPAGRKLLYYPGTKQRAKRLDPRRQPYPVTRADYRDMRQFPGKFKDHGEKKYFVMADTVGPRPSKPFFTWARPDMREAGRTEALKHFDEFVRRLLPRGRFVKQVRLGQLTTAADIV